ncbi:MAG TPA: hypothetical protein VN445_10060 [Rectinemataceae bacterium]|nr:hypothetical protein [Rectinemataceae bacterium]
MKGIANAWTFSRIGGVDQVVIRNGDDVAALGDLDQKLWAVLAMPAAQPAVRQTLEYLDADKDGKIRVPDILRTIGELKARLTTLDALFERNDRLAIDQMAEREMRDTATHVLAINAGVGQGLASAFCSSGIQAVDLAAVDKAIGAFSALPFNGDGVIVPASTEDEAVKGLLVALIGAGYSAQDSSGESGVDKSSLERFGTDYEAYRSWIKEADSYTELFPSDAEGRKASDLFRTIRPPLEDYFKRCRVLAMAGSPSAMGELEALMASILSQNLPEDAPELARLPAALPDASCVLRLDRALHPTYGKAILAFFGTMAKSHASSTAVSQAEWESMAATMDTYGRWLDGKPRSGVAILGAQVMDGVFGAETIAGLQGLVERDLAMAGEADSLRRLRTLLLLKRDFLRILCNFVNLEDFYVRKQGLFRAGKLFLDGRELELCLNVGNAPAHATMAGLSSMYLVYCDLSRVDGRKKAIVAVLTAGDADNIFIGRNGVFYDSEGLDWDAVITKTVVQPISIREAFFSPYKWLVRTLEEFSMKRAANAEVANMDKMKGIAQATAQVGKPDLKPEQMIPKKVDVGTVAAIGVALGSIGAMVTGILGMFFGLGVWMPLGIVGVFVLISGPSMILAYMKLRKRNIGPLLNAEGWAINGRLKINVPFGATLSHLAALPLSSTRQIKDPFAEKKKPWTLYILIVTIAALVAAYFAGWFGPLFG